MWQRALCKWCGGAGKEVLFTAEAPGYKWYGGFGTACLLGGLLVTTYINFHSNKDAIMSDINRVLLPSDIQNSYTTSLKIQQLELKAFMSIALTLRTKYLALFTGRVR